MGVGMPTSVAVILVPSNKKLDKEKSETKERLEKSGWRVNFCEYVQGDGSPEVMVRRLYPGGELREIG
jgi:hypothetical protein